MTLETFVLAGGVGRHRCRDMMYKHALCAVPVALGGVFFLLCVLPPLP